MGPRTYGVAACSSTGRSSQCQQTVLCVVAAPHIQGSQLGKHVRLTQVMDRGFKVLARKSKCSKEALHLLALVLPIDHTRANEALLHPVRTTGIREVSVHTRMDGQVSSGHTSRSHHSKTAERNLFHSLMPGENFHHLVAVYPCTDPGIVC